MKHTIKIHKVENSGGWGQVFVKDIEWCERSECPCCNHVLEVGCTLEGSDEKTIRIGICPRCQYVGYIDSPTKKWVDYFYDSTWDTANQKTKKDIKEIQKSDTSNIVMKYIKNTTDPILEVGVGYGIILQLLKRSGYKNVFGVEHSPHRARVAEEFSGTKVSHGTFEDQETLSKFRKAGPFSAVFSKSVLEHMYDPNIFFESAKYIQSEGGYIFILVPNVVYEPTITTLLFLPHLHGFSSRSLELLARKHGYTPEEIITEKGLILVARKSSSKKESFMSKDMPPGFLEKKWKKELCDESVQKKGLKYFYWSSLIDHNKVGVLPKNSQIILRILELQILRIVLTFPKKISPIFLRVFWGVSRRHRSLWYEIKEENNTTPKKIRIFMSNLFLFVK